MKLTFTKMHGAGNDYVYIDCFRQQVSCPGELSKLFSDRHKGIGGDGLVLICPSDVADAQMRMFNADGSEGSMCGNAIRCVSRYLFDHRMITGNDIRIETKSGIKDIHITEENGRFVSASVNMGLARFAPKDIPMLYDGDSFIAKPLEVQGKIWNCTAVSMGNPHCVTFVEDVDALPLEKIGPSFENHPLFPDRVNTEFIQLIDRTHIRMRVWERGSGETMACGTGSCAAVAACVQNGFCGIESPVEVQLRGGVLTDVYRSDGTVLMDGTASHVFEGVVDTDDFS